MNVYGTITKDNEENMTAIMVVQLESIAVQVYESIDGDQQRIFRR